MKSIRNTSADELMAIIDKYFSETSPEELKAAIERSRPKNENDSISYRIEYETVRHPHKDLNYYLSLPYTIEITPTVENGERSYFAKIVELPGCMTFADSFAELEPMLKEAQTLWLETAIEDGVAINEPAARSVSDMYQTFLQHPTASSFARGWREVQQGNYQNVDTLWDGINIK